MPNQQGWYRREEVLETGLPYFIPSSDRWTETPYTFAVLLTKSRCNELGFPIIGNEKPSAFRRIGKTGKDPHKFAPLYDRTEAFRSCRVTLDKLYKNETMGLP